MAYISGSLPTFSLSRTPKQKKQKIGITLGVFIKGRLLIRMTLWYLNLYFRLGTTGVHRVAPICVVFVEKLIDK